MTLTAQLRLLWRRAVRSPGFTLVALATLAIGIGANVAIFTVVNAVLLRPLPMPDSEGLVSLRHAAPGLTQLDELPLSDALYFLYAAESRTLNGVAAYRGEQASFTGADDPQRVQAASVSASFFDVMRTPPQLGRTFAPEEDRPGAARVLVLSDGLWQGRFGGEPGVVGRMVEVDGERVEVVGVMPPGFSFSRPQAEAWRPLRLDRDSTQLGAFSVNGVARLADGATLEQARAELATMLSNLVEVFPDEAAAPVLAAAGFRPLVDRAREVIVGDIEATLWILLGAVGFLLLIACANVANLFLVRSEARRGEAAIRAALGASRGRLTGSVLVESVVLGVAGGLAALPLAFLAVRLVVRFGPRALPRLDEITTDVAVLLFGLAVSVVAGILFGVLPALRAGAAAASGHMTSGARGASADRERQLPRRGLVVVQIALALTLLVGSGLAMRSFGRLASVDPGFDPVDVLTFGLSLPQRDYDAPDARLGFHRRMVERLRALPGSVDAAAASTIPLGGLVSGSGYSIEGRPRDDGEVPPVFMSKVVSPEYFDTLRIELVEGRPFDRLDGERGDSVLIVSRAVATTGWPGESALGKGIRAGAPPEEEGQEWSRIVGVVGDVHETALHEEPLPMVYYPLPATAGGAGAPATMRYAVRARNAAGLAVAVREAVRGLDPRLPIADVETLETLVARARAERAFVMVLLLIAAGLALLLGSVGLYGVVSYTVAQRRREIAIRMAVGARLADVRRLVLTEAGGLALVGAALGVGAAVALTRRLQALLFETSPLDPVVFLAVSALLVGVCLLASWLPARRASRIDPMTALRVE
ncbi:MAG: ABC transporter permease [Acidobacteria bacterium]|nr:ABC transporter permease [Acidobacteriota bacterium]